MSNVFLIGDNQVFKSAAAKVLGKFYNSEGKLCDIIEENYPNLSVAGRKVLLDMCESAIPLMIKLDYISKEKQNEKAY